MGGRSRSLYARLPWPAISACLLCASAVGAGAADEQEDSTGAASPPAESSAGRIERLSDVSAPNEDWVIGVPELAPSGFEAAVRAGRALDSDAYRELHAQLEALPNASAAERESAASALRARLRERIDVNTRLGYLYAAGVYVEMLSMAGAPDEEIDMLGDRLRRQRAFEEEFERFEQALSESRLVRPAGDNATFYLDRLGEFADADSRRLQQAEERLRAALADTRSEIEPP